MQIDLDLKIALAKIGKYCSSCTRCKKISEKEDYQQLLLDVMFEANELLDDFEAKRRDGIGNFLTDLVIICFECDAESALVFQKVSDYLLNKLGEVKRISKSGNIYRMPKRKIKKI